MDWPLYYLYPYIRSMNHRPGADECMPSALMAVAFIVFMTQTTQER